MLRMRMFTRHSIASCLWVATPITHTLLKSWWEGSVSLAVSHSHINLFSSNFLEHLLPLLHVHVWRSFRQTKQQQINFITKAKDLVSPPNSHKCLKFLDFFFNKPNKYREGNFVFLKGVLHLPFGRAKPASNLYQWTSQLYLLYRQLWSSKKSFSSLTLLLSKKLCLLISLAASVRYFSSFFWEILSLKSISA